MINILNLFRRPFIAIADEARQLRVINTALLDFEKKAENQKEESYLWNIRKDIVSLSKNSFEKLYVVQSLNKICREYSILNFNPKFIETCNIVEMFRLNKADISMLTSIEKDIVDYAKKMKDTRTDFGLENGWLIKEDSVFIGHFKRNANLIAEAFCNRKTC